MFQTADNLLFESPLYIAAKVQELLSVAKLVDLAMQRLPAAFTGDNCTTATTMLMQLVPILANLSLRYAQPDRNQKDGFLYNALY